MDGLSRRTGRASQGCPGRADSPPRGASRALQRPTERRSMNHRVFYSLPSPREVGLKWKPYEQARQNVERIEGRYHEAGRTTRELEERIRAEQSADVRGLAQAILSGEDDPAAPSEKPEGLAA